MEHRDQNFGQNLTSGAKSGACFCVNFQKKVTKFRVRISFFLRPTRRKPIDDERSVFDDKSREIGGYFLSTCNFSGPVRCSPMRSLKMSTVPTSESVTNC